MEPRHVKTHLTTHIPSSCFRLVNWYCSVFRFLTPDAQNRTERKNKGDSGWTRDTGVDDWTKTAHVTENGREIARTVRLLPLGQRVYVSLLKCVKELPWDGQGLVRRGRPPKLTLENPTMAEAGETLRTGGSSSSGTRSSPARPESDTVKALPEDRMDAFGEAAT